MIAAGSLFTSCVTNTEPQGVKDLREARADYIESLAKLNAAKEALVAAEAAYKNAEATVEAAKVAVVEAQAAQEQAKAAQEQARVDVIKAQAAEQEIKNAKAQAELEKQIALDSIKIAQALLDAANYEVYSRVELESKIKKLESEIAGYEATIAAKEAEIAKSENDIAKAKAAAEKIAVDAEKALAYAQKELIKAQLALAKQEDAFLAYLSMMEMKSYTLTPAEQAAVKEYKAAYTDVVAAKQWVREVEKLIFDFNGEIEAEDAKALKSLQNAVVSDSTSVEWYKEQIANAEAYLASLPDSGKTFEEVKALEAKYENDLKALALDTANLNREYNTYLATELGEPITGFATELGDWVAKNAALPAPFDMHFKAELPDNGAVSDLFKASVEKFYTTEDEESDSPVKVDDGYIYANFKTSPAAKEGVEAIDSIIDAISRKYIIDSVGVGGLDTAGLAKAVEDAEEEYAAVADTLEKGLAKYDAYVDAQDSLKQAVEDTAKAFAAYKTAFADTVAKNKEKHDADSVAKAVKDTLDDYFGEGGIYTKAKADSISAGTYYKDADKKLAKATAERDSVNSRLDSLVDLSENLGPWKEAAEDEKALAEVRKNRAETNKTTAENKVEEAKAKFIEERAKYNDAEDEGTLTDSLTNVFNKAKDAFEDAKRDTAAANKAYADATKEFNEASEKLTELQSITEADLETKIANAKEDTAEYNKKFIGADTTFANATADLEKAVKAYDKAVDDTLAFTNALTVAKQDTAKANAAKKLADAAIDKAIKDTTNAVNFLAKVNDKIIPDAKEAYYTNIYCKFWGVKYGNLHFDEETGFLKDSIPYKDFTETFKKAEAKDIVKFTIESSVATPFYKDGKFNFYKGEENGITPLVTLVRNTEIDIILKQLEAHKVTDFEATLLCQLFAKQQYADDIFAKVGSIDNDAALKALTKIKKDLADEFDKASAKQEAASQPFFKFVQDLVGEEFLNTLFAKIDSALAKAAEFQDEPKPEAKTAKQYVAQWFEDMLCNDVSEDYRGVYEKFQIADAFSREQFRTLLSDVIAQKIKAQKFEKNITFVGEGTPLETLLAEAVSKMIDDDTSDIVKTALELISENPTKYASYVIKDFGGKIAELQTKWFAEWSAKAAEYAKATAEITAKIENTKALQKVLKIYTADETVKELMGEEEFNEGIIGWMKWQLSFFENAYAEAKAALEAFVAGPDFYQKLKQDHLADVLAKAENDLAVAEEYLKIATAAYEAVLANHKVTE